LPASSHPTRKPLAGNKAQRIAALRARDGWKCQLCGKDFADPAPAHPDEMSVTVDHLEPAWKGGSAALEDLRLAHRICNMRRGGVELSPAQQRRNEKAAQHWSNPENVKALLAKITASRKGSG
jgi:5-methylcytosine-specific restriction endonuclease McrA